MKVWLTALLWVSSFVSVNNTAAPLFAANTHEIMLPTAEITAKKVVAKKTKKIYNAHLSFQRQVNKGFSNSLLEALNTYKGPKITVSSGVRKHSRKSKHYHGNAIDIHWDESAKHFIMWCNTDEGEAWLEENQLQFFVEDKYDSTKEQLGYFSKYFRKISWASGLHIHLEKK